MSYQPSSRENRRGKGNGEYMSSYQKRQAWTPEEDEILKQQVARLGTHCWPDVASGLVGRTSKACSLRWRCFLSPTIIRPNEEPFSAWEIAVIVLTQKMFGNKWNDIANYLPMRCNNDIKNHFNLYLKDKHQQVALENNYLRQGYDLPSLLASEPEEVQQRRERLEKERTNSNNFDHAPAKPSNRGMSSYLRRAAPAKPKPSAVSKYHPYHVGAGAAVLAAAAQSGNAGLAGVTRTGSGAALTADCDGTSPAPQQHQAYAAFTALPHPHSAQSMGALDALRLGGGLRTASLVNAAGLTSSLLYSSMQAACASPSTLLGQGMLTEQMMQQNATIQSLSTDSGIKQEQQPAGSMRTTPAAAGTYSSYAGGSTALPSGGSSSCAGSEWQLNVQYATGGLQLAGGVGSCEEGITRNPSRLQQVGHPDLSSIMGHSCSMAYAGQPQGMEQQSCLGPGSQEAAAADVAAVGLQDFDKMPSLPDPTAEPCNIFDACGDGDGTCLRGIFSSDDGEHPPLAAQQGQSLGGAAAAGEAPGLLPPQGSGSLASKQHGSPTEQQLAVPAAVFSSPCSFASNGSPAHLHQFIEADMRQSQQQQQQQPGIIRPAVKLHVDIKCAVRNAAYDSHVVAGGERGALSAPCTVTAAYSPHGSHMQQQHSQQLLPHGAFSQVGQEMQQHGYIQLQQQQQQQMLQQSHYHHTQQQSQQQLLQGKYTPFGHIDNQLQQPHHQMGSLTFVQQYHALPYQAAAMTAYDSALSSHLHQQHPGQDMSSPSTMAGSAAAAVARAATAAAAHCWGSSPTSDAAAAVMVSQQQQQHFDLKQQQQSEEVVARELLDRAASDDLGPLAHLLESDDNDHCGHAGHHGLVEHADCELLLSDGCDFDHAEFALPGMHKDSCQVELELMAAAACW